MPKDAQTHRALNGRKSKEHGAWRSGEAAFPVSAFHWTGNGLFSSRQNFSRTMRAGHALGQSSCVGRMFPKKA